MSTRYPFRYLRIGESVTVHDVASRATINASLKQWRDALLSNGGLGYTRDNCPQFSISYDAVRHSAEVVRLHDGPIQVGRKHKASRSQASDPQAPEKAWLRRHLVALADITAGPQRAPLDVLEVARAWPGLVECFLALERPNPGGSADAIGEWMDARSSALARGCAVLSGPL
jgi:hypothetical protein